MKKIFSFFVMTACTLALSAATVTFSDADFTGGTESVGSAFSVTKDGVTVSSDKAYGTGYELRVYQSGTLTVDAGTEIITKITPVFGKNTKMQFDQVMPNATTWTIEATKQIRLTSLTVEIGGDTTIVPVDTIIPVDTIVPVDTLAPEVRQYEVAEAIAAGLADDTEIIVRGVITKMQIKGKNFAKYGSVNIYVKDATGAEGEFEFFNCYSLDTATFTTTAPAYDETSTAWLNLKKAVDAAGNEIRTGDTVIARGKYKLFNTTHELNTGCYLTDIKSAPLLPPDTITFVANYATDWTRYTDATAEEGWWQVQAEDSTYYITLSNAGSIASAPGTYSVADLDAEYSFIEILETEEDIAFVDGSFTLAVSAEGVVTVVGELLGDDDNTYKINITYKDPTAQKTVVVNISDGELDDTYAVIDLYAVYGQNESTYVQLGIWAENGFQGNFTEYDLDEQMIGSYVEDADGQYDIFSASINVLPGNTDGAYKVTGDILCYNNTLYQLTMYVGGSAEGIDNCQQPTANSQKLIRNGQLVIEKAGKKYSVLGAEIR